MIAFVQIADTGRRHAWAAPRGSGAERVGLALLSALLYLLGTFQGASQPADQEHEGEPASASRPSAVPLAPSGTFDDRQIVSRLISVGEGLVAEGQTVPMDALVRQLGRKSCVLKLPRPPWRKVSATRLVAKYQPGVLILGHLYKCKTCPHHHARTSTGFILTRSGAAIAAYHAVDSPEDQTIVAMTGDGRIAPVREVLAANEESDLVIIQLDGDRYTPLPIAREEVPVGTPARVISHPDGQHFALSDGLLSRYYVFRKGPGEMTMMAITADFAKGSSGAPVFDDRGAVIGVANNTRSIYYNVDQGRKENLQMVLKNCVPARYIRELIRKP